MRAAKLKLFDNEIENRSSVSSSQKSGKQLPADMDVNKGYIQSKSTW